MNLQITSIVTLTVLVAGTIAALSSLAVATQASAARDFFPGQDWCYTARENPLEEREHCFDNRGACNQQQSKDLSSSSSCYKKAISF